MKLVKNILAFFLFSVFSFQRVTAQQTCIDFTKHFYNTPLNYADKKIGVIKRSKQLLDTVQINQVADFKSAKFLSFADFRDINFYAAADFSESDFRFAANFSHARFYSNEDFRDLKFHAKTDFSSAIFYKDALFTDSHFDSFAIFTQTHFDTAAYFYTVIFDSEANFSRAEFNSLADFTEVKFQSRSIFAYAHFHSDALFGYVDFYSDAFFNNGRFDSDASFREVEFNSKADFSKVRFNSTVDYNMAKFHVSTYFIDSHCGSIADFGATHFYSLANFSGAEFDSTANFRYTHFDSLVDFTYCHFYKKLCLTNLITSRATRFDFNHSILSDTIDISHNPNIFFKLPLIIDFTLSDFPEDMTPKSSHKEVRKLKFIVGNYFFPNKFASTGKHLINLYNTDISKIKIDYTHFCLYFKDNEAIQDNELSYDKKASIYEQLLKTFKDKGQADSYEKLDIEYQRFKGSEYPVLTNFIDFWWRFGYEKKRIFLHSIFLILLFSICNFFWIHRLNDKNNGVYNIERVPEFSAFKYSKNNPYRLIRRFWFSMVYTAILFFLPNGLHCKFSAQF